MYLNVQNMCHDTRQGDVVVIDNLAVAHKAAPAAHACPTKQGLRILHRTTVRGTQNLDPGPDFGDTPREVYIFGQSPYGEGIFQGGTSGFKWHPKIRFQN